MAPGHSPHLSDLSTTPLPLTPPTPLTHVHTSHTCSHCFTPVHTCPHLSTPMWLGVLVLVGVMCAVRAGYYGNYNCVHGRDVFVHLFEWRWPDVAQECEQHLASLGYCAVQVRCCHRAVMVLSPCSHGAVTVFSWCCHGAVTVLSWCCYRAVMVLSPCCHGAVTVLSWCCTVLSWCCTVLSWCCTALS